MSTALMGLPLPSIHLGHTGAARPPQSGLLCLKCPSGASGSPSQADLLPDSEAESPVSASASSTGRGRVWAKHLVSPAYPKPAGRQGTWGVLPQGQSSKAEPHPRADPENRPQLGRRWRGAEGRTTGSQAQGQRLGPSPLIHTPLSFKGRGPSTPQMSQGQLQALSSHRSPSRPLPGLPLVSLRAGVPRAAFPSPRPLDRAPPPPAPPPTRPGAAQ